VHDLEAARAAKEKLKRLVAGVSGVCGVGITATGTAYAVKVNLSREPEDPAVIPPDVDGVPVVRQVVGEVGKQRREPTSED
jgi:hypothetical protein